MGAANVWNMGSEINLLPSSASGVRRRRREPVRLYDVSPCAVSASPLDVVRLGLGLVDDGVQRDPGVVGENGQLGHAGRSAGRHEAGGSPLRDHLVVEPDPVIFSMPEKLPPRSVALGRAFGLRENEHIGVRELQYLRGRFHGREEVWRRDHQVGPRRLEDARELYGLIRRIGANVHRPGPDDGEEEQRIVDLTRSASSDVWA